MAQLVGLPLEQTRIPAAHVPADVLERRKDRLDTIPTSCCLMRRCDRP